MQTFRLSNRIRRAFAHQLVNPHLRVEQINCRDHADAACAERIWELDARHTAKDVEGAVRILHQLFEVGRGAFTLQKADIRVSAVQRLQRPVRQAGRHQARSVLHRKRDVDLFCDAAQKADIFAFRHACDRGRLQNAPVGACVLRSVHERYLARNAAFANCHGERDASGDVFADPVDNLATLVDV